MSYHFTIATIAALDESGPCDHCSLDNHDIEVQLYFADRDGQRRMEMCCVNCVLTLVGTYAEPGTAVEVEIEAHTHRDLTARLADHGTEQDTRERTDAVLLASAFGR